MSITVSIDLGYAFDVTARAKEVFEVLADVPVSASYFPHVDKLVDLGGGAYRWEMKKIGLPQINLQTVYASTYVANKAKKTIVWTPVEGVGNAQVSGDWKIVDNKSSTHVELRISGELSVPLPSLLEPVIAPAVEHEFEKLVELYIHNLVERFGGEVDA